MGKLDKDRPLDKKGINGCRQTAEDVVNEGNNKKAGNCPNKITTKTRQMFNKGF